MKKLTHTLVLVVALVMSAIECQCQRIFFLSDSLPTVKLVPDDFMEGKEDKVWCYTEYADCSEIVVYDNPDSRVMRYRTYVHSDTMIFLDYYSNGALKRISKHLTDEWCLPLREIELKVLCRNGSNRLNFRTNVDSLVQSGTVYWCNGRVRMKYMQNNMTGALVDKAFLYHSNGQLEVIWNFSEENISCGDWLYYNRKGKVFLSEKYDCQTGKLIGKKRKFWVRKDSLKDEEY